MRLRTATLPFVFLMRSLRTPRSSFSSGSVMLGMWKLPMSLSERSTKPWTRNAASVSHEEQASHVGKAV